MTNQHGRAPPSRPSRRDADLHVPAEAGEEVHEALEREPVEAVADQVGDVRLAHAEQLRRALLRETSLLEDAVHLHGELHLEAALVEDPYRAARKRLSPLHDALRRSTPSNIR